MDLKTLLDHVKFYYLNERFAQVCSIMIRPSFYVERTFPIWLIVAILRSEADHPILLLYNKHRFSRA